MQHTRLTRHVCAYVSYVVHHVTSNVVVRLGAPSIAGDIKAV